MTLLPVHRKAIHQADVQYRQLDSDRFNAHTEVHRLTKAGVSAEAIGGLLNLSERQVQRIRVSQPPPQRFYEFDNSEERMCELDRTVDAVIELACKLRDQDPQLVFKSLDLLDEESLRELTMVALAGIPVDMTANDLFGWCQP